MQQTTTYQLIEYIEDLRLDKFIDCLCDQRLTVLIVSGNPSGIDLMECWSNLYAQYLDILDDAETLYALHLQRDAELLNYKITTTEAIVKVLEFFHVEHLVGTLKGFGFSVINLKQGHSGYAHALNRITAKLAPMKLRLKEKTQELTDYYRDQKMDTVSRQFFTRQLQRLSKFQGYPIRPQKTMVPEYIAILKDYLAQNFKTKTDGKEG